MWTKVLSVLLTLLLVVPFPELPGPLEVGILVIGLAIVIVAYLLENRAGRLGQRLPAGQLIAVGVVALAAVALAVSPVDVAPTRLVRMTAIGLMIVGLAWTVVERRKRHQR